MRDSFHSSSFHCFDFRCHVTSAWLWPQTEVFNVISNRCLLCETIENGGLRCSRLNWIRSFGIITSKERSWFRKFSRRIRRRKVVISCTNYSIISQYFWSFFAMLINRNAAKTLRTHANVQWSLRARKNARLVLWLNTHHARVTSVHIKPPVYKLFYFLFSFLFDLQH